MQTLEKRTCVFAGASGGDGVAAVKALCKGGMDVVMLTHQPAQAQKLIREMEGLAYPGKCGAVQDGNCQNPPIPDEEVYRRIFEEYGSIDVVICNTGGDGFEDSIDLVDTDFMLKEVGHLLGGSYSMLKCALPYLRQSRAPRVIFMTTVEGVRGGRLESFTNAVAKGAVAALGKNCAARLASEGITVNCIEKGAIARLPHNGPALEPKGKDTSGMLSCIPVGRMGTPEDLAEAICFLASEESAYITGAVLDVSGGLSLV
ncbi:SDR family NAD(P)-dependent oxidoreductase [Parablautia muri]|uniref:SDR family oxidoreductase n=1 Tax=Parablautia muri TaxID=2320879 RepID=A0A9X5BFQ9_9FIRM|nr:SDR family oxidoreductase [Parablautia muri]NBJ92864.1 SDR family oxidoreductase [Parablautia muri]